MVSRLSESGGLVKKVLSSGPFISRWYHPVLECFVPPAIECCTMVQIVVRELVNPCV